MRKYWDKRWERQLGLSTSGGVQKAHFAQTAHSKSTAEKHYTERQGTREDRRALLELYKQDLENFEFNENEQEEKINQTVEEDREEEDNSDLEEPAPLIIQQAEAKQELEKGDHVATRAAKIRIVEANKPIQPTYSRLPKVLKVPTVKTPRAQESIILTDTPELNSSHVSSILFSDPRREAHEKKTREAYLKTLRTFRKTPFTQEEKEAVECFADAYFTLNVGSIREKLESCGYRFNEEQVRKIHKKQNWAAQNFNKWKF